MSAATPRAAAVAVGLVNALNRREPSIRLIAEASALRFDVTYTDLISARRTARVVMPRQIAAYLARKHTTRSLPDIGRHLGGRDHTTILHACQAVGRRIADPQVAAAVSEIELAVGCGQLAMQATGAETFADVDVFAVSGRILDGDACRVSADEVRAMAGFIRGQILPVVDLDDAQAQLAAALAGPEPAAAPQRGPSVRVAAQDAARAWSELKAAQFTARERPAAAALDQSMLALRAALDA